MALAFAPLFGILILVLSQWYAQLPPGDSVPFADLDRNDNVHTGKDAKNRILKRAHSDVRHRSDRSTIPDSANEFWLYDGGTFNGSIVYWLFDCGSREDCLKAVAYLDEIRADEMKSWAPANEIVCPPCALGLEHSVSRDPTATTAARVAGLSLTVRRAMVVVLMLGVHFAFVRMLLANDHFLGSAPFIRSDTANVA